MYELFWVENRRPLTVALLGQIFSIEDSCKAHSFTTPENMRVWIATPHLETETGMERRNKEETESNFFPLQLRYRRRCEIVEQQPEQS
jgi:hypothetical protein